MALFGIVNAVAIMASAVFMATALAIAGDTPPSHRPATPRARSGCSSGGDGELGVGALFFGLWLIAMGWGAITSSRFPTPLGWLLVAGGVGYVISALGADRPR